MGDWIRYDDNFDGGGDGGCLYARDNENGTYNVAGVMWMDAVGDEKPYFAFEAEVAEGDRFDDLTVMDIYSAGDCFTYLTDPYVVNEIGSFDTLEEGTIAVDKFYLPLNEFLEMHPNA